MTRAHPPGVEPIAALVKSALDAAGWSPADAVRRTGISTQHMSQIVNRHKPYGNRLPSIETLQRLSKIPGLTQAMINEAAAQSAGIAVGPKPPSEGSSVRRSVHAIVDEFSDDQLSRVLQVLIAMRD